MMAELMKAQVLAWLFCPSLLLCRREDGALLPNVECVRAACRGPP